LDFLVRTTRQEEETKEYKLERKYSNYVILADDIILYLNDPKKSTTNLLNINTFIIVNKINLEKPVVFLFTKMNRLRKNIGIQSNFQ
jgi:hypothetical protein